MAKQRRDGELKINTYTESNNKTIIIKKECMMIFENLLSNLIDHCWAFEFWKQLT